MVQKEEGREGERVEKEVGIKADVKGERRK
jgi:hypothetical protein